ncbi:sn-glycerol-3-phosphate ABC transporter ATP-binding protein UgpC [Mesorhizobium sp. NZP2077]|uniref:ABC transporter ATP-binding protein n=1 Tax=Mesorhizobium sp. NZP2077 TaxID=2483404 RepID=UPI0015569178|nr:sn-glycerol-3-phosphate ABC transporter ATP-binding protein UgpC [Mesorhizobium sp. NZP2077]QKC85383.1 sn-glycerol-3-phosphate ABC transporter ATP-binding protein UgpC [Mesorhizobium sp. NZP2077]QKD19022.1 sn-glycerol-3-phosphate ABC transporter ATP-binding protein UgpC [Mesorhizobium sp. NZP2077]
MAEVSLRDLVKVYGRQPAVRGIDLDIADREFVVFVGPSGCGKSTTLRMIAGLETISHGELKIGGRVVNDVPSRQRGVAMVFQTYALYPHMTVRQNMSFGLRLAGLPKPEIEARVARAVEVLELGPYLDRKPAQLSGGQRQRVAMGRAIVREPAVFLFDEPLSNLDAKLRNQMRIEIKRLQKRLNVTTIYVTHDQVEAMTLADRIVVMKDGLIAQVGTPSELYDNPADLFVAGFIGAPAMNFFPGSIEATGEGTLSFRSSAFEAPIVQGRFSGLAPGLPVVAGLRPDDIVPVGHGMAPARPVAARGTVILAEMLGGESQVLLRLGEVEAIARMGNPRPVVTDEKLPLALDIEKLHLFAASSGLTLRAQADQR